MKDATHIGPEQNGYNDTTDKHNDGHAGTIIGSVTDVFRIIAASNIPLGRESLFRVSKHADEEFSFKILTSASNVNPVEYNGGNDVFISRPAKYIVTSESKLVERAILQSPYSARDHIKSLPGKYSAEYTNGMVPKWNIKTKHIPGLISDFLDSGYDIVMEDSTVEEYYDPHPTLTIFDDSPIMALSDDRSEPSTQKTQMGLDKRKLKHTISNGYCPAQGCDFEANTFEQLQGHLGGMCVHNCEDHQEISFTREQFNVTEVTNP